MILPHLQAAKTERVACLGRAYKHFASAPAKQQGLFLQDCMLGDCQSGSAFNRLSLAYAKTRHPAADREGRLLIWGIMQHVKKRSWLDLITLVCYTEFKLLSKCLKVLYYVGYKLKGETFYFI